MARTKIVKDDSPYSKLGVGELKKLLEERKIDGRSKLTKKEGMVKVLDLYDQDPEDKAAIKALIAEIGTPKKTASTEKSKDETNPPESEVIITDSLSERVPPSSEEKNEKNTEPKKVKKTSAEIKDSKISETSLIPEKEKSTDEKTTSDIISAPILNPKNKKDDWLLSEGIRREDYPPGCRFVKTKSGKVKVHYPKDCKGDSDEKNEVVKVKNVKQIEEQDERPNTEQENKKEEQEEVVDKKEQDVNNEEQEVDKQQPIEKEEAEPEQSQEPTPEEPAEKEPEPEPETEESQESKPEEHELEQSQSSEEESPILDQETIDKDEDMKEIFKLSRDILKRLKVFAREAVGDDEFKKEWIVALKKMKKNFDHQLVMMDAYDQEMLGELIK